MNLDLEKKMGPLRLRAWGLVANLIANLIALLGLSMIYRGESGWALLTVGVIATIILVWILSKPQK